MKVSKEQLIVPVYLNEKIVLDMLAIVEDGFSMVSDVTSSLENNDKSSSKVEGGFSTANILSKLLKIQLNTGIQEDIEGKEIETLHHEKVHTNVSLFSKLRIVLKNNELLFCNSDKKIDIDKYNTGDFIEIEGELQKNPMIDLIEKFLNVMKMADIFEDKVQVGQKKRVANEKATTQKLLKQIEQFLKELKNTGTVDFIIENEDITLVLSAQEKYMENDNISELYGGKFKVLGKVIKVCSNEKEKIDLLRKTTLGVLDDQSKQAFLSAFNNEELSKFNLPALRTEIKGPAFIVIPIAIYA